MDEMGGAGGTHALIHQLHVEELAVTAGVAPCADAALVGDAGADCPPGGDGGNAA